MLPFLISDIPAMFRTSKGASMKIVMTDPTTQTTAVVQSFDSTLATDKSISLLNRPDSFGKERHSNSKVSITKFGTSWLEIHPLKEKYRRRAAPRQPQ
jgi:hypothetical protein